MVGRDREQVLRLAGTLRPRYEHKGWVPGDFWLADWDERQAIVAFHLKNPLDGYRRLRFMMLDARHRGGEPMERVAGTWAKPGC